MSVKQLPSPPVIRSSEPPKLQHRGPRESYILISQLTGCCSLTQTD
uniref:Uncharacterized protein n=1 Tax=Anguilla anguilla TaxID=7936 RepID=A0A0E9U1J0_ANGAN